MTGKPKRQQGPSDFGTGTKPPTRQEDPDLWSVHESLSLTESDVYDAICSALRTSPDYRGEVRVAVDELLRIIIRFVTTRTNAQSNLRPYLFDPDAKEDKIHLDLNEFLASSELGSYVRFEEPHVGDGRIDLRLTFNGFAIHIEMKVHSTKLPMSDRMPTSNRRRLISLRTSESDSSLRSGTRHSIRPGHLRT